MNASDLRALASQKFAGNSWWAEHEARMAEIERVNAPAEARYQAQKSQWDAQADAWNAQYGEQAKVRAAEWAANPAYTPTMATRLDNPRQTFLRPTTARPASQSFAESFDAVAALFKGGKQVGAVNQSGQALMFSEDPLLTGVSVVPFQEIDKSGFMSDSLRNVWTPPKNWSVTTAERYTLPSVETKAVLSEQKKQYEEALSEIKSKTESAKAKATELGEDIAGTEEEGEEIKALTAAAREKLSQLALSETKIRAGIIDKTRGRVAARRGMAGGRESLFTLGERGFEEGAEFAPRARSSQRANERGLMSILGGATGGATGRATGGATGGVARPAPEGVSQAVWDSYQTRVESVRSGRLPWTTLRNR